MNKSQLKKQRNGRSRHSMTTIACLTSILVLVSTISPQPLVSALTLYNSGSEEWMETYNYLPEIEYYEPRNISTAMIEIDDGPGAIIFQAGLSASIYNYERATDDLNKVHFRLAAYFNSTAAGNYLPVFAQSIILMVEKENYYGDQAIIVKNCTSSDPRPYFQGTNIWPESYFDPLNLFSIFNEITQSESGAVSRVALEAVIGYCLTGNPGGTAAAVIICETLIQGSKAFAPRSQDFQQAPIGGPNRAYMWWTTGGVGFGTDQSISQYCFNMIDWYQDKWVNPFNPLTMGIKVWARFIIDGPNVGMFDNTIYDTPPLYLRLLRQGGSGCPILYAWDGATFVDEGLLDIHNPEGDDVSVEHSLRTPLERKNGRYNLRLIEHLKTISHIDQVKLMGRLKNGHWIRLPLLSATHSEEGQVRRLLRLSDDLRVDLYGANHNDGTSESLDLEFLAPRGLNIVEFRFQIEGNNPLPTK